jgi:hypothetical protein
MVADDRTAYFTGVRLTMGFVFELLAEFLLGPIVGLLVRLILLPLYWIVSTPVILVVSLVRRGRYRDNVKRMFESVHRFWQSSIDFVP